MYNARLTKIESNHKNLRTNSMEGEISDLPKIGFPLIIVNDKPLDPKAGDSRMIWTTNIVEINKKSDEEYEFKTQNSTYKLDILGKVDDQSK